MQTIVEIALGFLELLAPSTCPGCSLPSGGIVGFCPACAPLLERSEEPDVAYVFAGPLARAIGSLKYEGRTEHAGTLGALFEPALDVFVGRVDVVVPIPLHARRHRERGFNQSSLLGARVARTLGVPLDVTLLSRARDTGAQVGRDRTGRSVMLRGAFLADARAKGRRVLVVDDVRTTGATFEAALAALEAVGVASADPLALAGADR